jgi:hypothetical protein
MPTSIPIIDADAHVFETERTWDFSNPQIASFDRDSTHRRMTRRGNIG